MRLKTNLVISVIFLALLGFVYFYEIRGGEERKAEAERARQLLDFSDHEAQRLTIAQQDTVVVLESGDEGWRLIRPVQTGADQSAIERYLRNLRETETEGEPLQDSASVAGDPAALTQYGLSVPRLRVLLELADGSETRLDTLRFGDDTPTDRFTYLQRSGANPEVLRVRAWRFDNLDKGIFDLRDRRLLAFEQDEVRRLRLDRRVEPVDLSRDGDDWQLEAPLSRPADDGEVTGILSRLRNAEVSEIVLEDPAPGQLDSLGLGERAAFGEVTLWVGEDRAEKRLRIGSEHEKGGRFARDSSRKHVFVVDSTVVNELLTPLSDLRDKKILELDEDEVARVEVRGRGESRFAASRDSTGAWSLEGAADREVKTWRFNSLINDLNALEVNRFVEDDVEPSSLSAYGMAPPRMSFHIDRVDGEAVELVVGAATEDGHVYVMRADVASVARVEADIVNNLDLSLDDVSTVIEEAAAEAAETGG